MMQKNEIAYGVEQTADYHLPYETTEALVRRKLVKLLIPADEMLAEEEAPVEEATTEEAPVEETPIEEAPVEVEEESAEEDVELPEDAVLTEDESGNEGELVINGRTFLVKYRRSFMSRLIQTTEKNQDYYTVIKNALTSYKKVKSRLSWSCETYNKGRLQLAKVNIKGKTLVLYLALNPADYLDTKYRFTDVSDKTKFAKVPMMLKIRSDRALKYALELIADMMQKNEIAYGVEQTADYRLPFESTSELIGKGLVKLLVPDGGALLDSASEQTAAE